ncbi:hypothetical protein TRFO_06576 [Tritrichomonas foetus]|uniref:Myb-like DNA-binding domain containing protein n=1 Tax=Tritrichomonas foetus TaxID=1144522 RepID=A0A1J4JYG7_9EUKA|nr:hypothetical protein TRFO_06576 [Tritrichomonas foetus]|eukprot:OHT03738.1 hypothetical protein TRFO_06576 [Tritrichomonas foetus]
MNWDIPPLKNPRKHVSLIRKKFTSEEDETLRRLVQEYGAKKWDQIAQMMPGRTGRQCRDRYRNYLIPGFFNGQWSQDEDQLLHEKFNQMGPQWARMMQYFPGRSANSLKNRWNYFVCRIAKNDGQDNESDQNTTETNQNEVELETSKMKDNENDQANQIHENDDKKSVNIETPNYQHAGENCRNAGENYQHVGENYRNAGENYQHVGENYRNAGENCRNVGENCRNVGENCRSISEAHTSGVENENANSDMQIPENLSNHGNNNNPHHHINVTYPHHDVRIIYGVNAGTQTNESDLIEHARSNL